MNENDINRRQMIKMSSVAALSAMVPPSPVTAKGNTFKEEFPNAEGEVCFMKALDLAVLLRNKKISAREVMEAHLT